MHYRTALLSATAATALLLTIEAPTAHADNKRLNDGVVANVYTVQHQAGCVNDVKINPQLQLAAQWHAEDVLNNRELDGDIGTDGSTPQSRADAAGYRGVAAETVAIHPALAISGVELLNRWHGDPTDLAIMQNCANTEIGVWSVNSLDRTVVVAMYGQPAVPPAPYVGPDAGLPPGTVLAENTPLSPVPDYDGTDEVEYAISWLPFILRGVYPPPAYPGQ
jgi:uncharacterized protein YkwD